MTVLMVENYLQNKKGCSKMRSTGWIRAGSKAAF